MIWIKIERRQMLAEVIYITSYMETDASNSWYQ